MRRKSPTLRYEADQALEPRGANFAAKSSDLRNDRAHLAPRSCRGESPRVSRGGQADADGIPILIPMREIRRAIRPD
ncbi:unnamed protein product [Coccothraustes coccothraustes]